MADERRSPEAIDSLINRVPLRAGEVAATRAHLDNFIKSTYSSGPDAGFEYERALSAIRRVPEAAVIEIAKGLGTSAPHDYPTRWALVFAACELGHRAAIPLLISLVDEPLPPEPGPPSHGFSIVANETMLRTTAIEGLGPFAKAGDKNAIEALFRVLQQPSVSLKRAAVQALLLARNTNARLKASLPPEYHFLLALKKLKVTEAPQIPRPQQFLSDEARQRTALEPPAIPGSGQTARPSRSPKK